MGCIYVVGFGPGSVEHITARAREAIAESSAVIGYNTYVDLLASLVADKEIVRTGMTEEVSRAQRAVDLAMGGRTVAVISSGDAGLYGMAGLVYEVLMEHGWQPGDNPTVEVIPGISAIHSCAALLGAPIMHDACTISLSDHLTPWSVIEQRLEAAAAADFVIALYNPRSGRRTRQIVEAQRILLKYRRPDTPVGLVKSAYRSRQQVVRTTLSDMLNHEIGMLTTVIIGNQSTFYYGDLMITPRGYQRKYTLGEATQRLRPKDRLKPENEPWALPQAPRQTDTHPGHHAGSGTTAPNTPRAWAEAALAQLERRADPKPALSGTPPAEAVSAIPVAHSWPNAQTQILEVAVSPGVANKKFLPSQLLVLADLAGSTGEIEYTTAHQLILRVATDDPEHVVSQLQEAGLTVLPTGDVVKVKACDFCDGEKADGIPYAETIARRLAGLSVEKELRIGYNGCAMSCYGAVTEDIGLVFRKGKFDLFLGGKTTGRNAGPGQRVAEGIPAEEMPDLLERIVQRYRQEAFPGERFHKFFARVGEIEGFSHTSQPQTIAVDSPCGS